MAGPKKYHHQNKMAGISGPGDLQRVHGLGQIFRLNIQHREHQDGARHIEDADKGGAAQRVIGMAHGKRDALTNAAQRSRDQQIELADGGEIACDVLEIAAGVSKYKVGDRVIARVGKFVEATPRLHIATSILLQKGVFPNDPDLNSNIPDAEPGVLAVTEQIDAIFARPAHGA